MRGRLVCGAGAPAATRPEEACDPEEACGEDDKNKIRLSVLEDLTDTLRHPVPQSL